MLKRTHPGIDYDFEESRKFGRNRLGPDAKFESSLNSRCRPGKAACSGASEAVRGCEAEGREEKGCEEEGGDEGRQMERERAYRVSCGGDSVSLVWRLCRDQPLLFPVNRHDFPRLAHHQVRSTLT